MTNLLRVATVQFPNPRGLFVNMMPFVMGQHSSIPTEFQQYIPLIDACGLESAQIGKVGYLSIQESAVSTGASQRRPGIHTEKHPSISWGGGWGHGQFDGTRRDGVYMASTVADSCRAWDFHVDLPGAMGDCEHLRHEIECVTPAISMPANTLYWMTDSCPHESLPLANSTFRQWFRLVTHKVSLWYAQHSTPNPLGVQPVCPVIYADKFAAKEK